MKAPHVRQAIRTHYLGPTDNRGSRVVVSAEAGRKVVPWQHEHDATDNHYMAAYFFASSYGWLDRGWSLAGGRLPDDSYAWVLVPPALDDDERKLIDDALDSHVYWQLSDAHHRRDGYVDDECVDGDDEDAQNSRAEVEACRALARRLGGSL